MTTQEERIFNGYGWLASAVTDIVEAFEPFSYSFMSDTEFRNLLEHATDPYETDRICLIEILHKAHLAATTSLVRTDRWIKGVYQADNTNNYLLFAAAARGLLESCADTHYSLSTVPRTLATHAGQMFECILRVPRSHSYIFNELEDQLIHFSHGRKVQKKEIVPESHTALHMRTYLDSLQGGPSGPLHDFYSELCEITHPAHDSVWCMLPKTGDSTWRLDTTFDRGFIDSLCHRHRDALDILLPKGTAPSLMTLGLINHMKIDELYTQAVDRINLSIIGRFPEFKDKISSAFIAN